MPENINPKAQIPASVFIVVTELVIISEGIKEVLRLRLVRLSNPDKFIPDLVNTII